MEKKQDIASLIENTHFDMHSPIPLYHQAYTFIKQMVTDGYFNDGDPLPPEVELADTLKVSRQTIRQAMSLLVSEGMVERFSGKGTFISLKNPRNQFFLDKSFSQQMADLGIETYSRVLEKFKGIVDQNTSKFLIDKLGAPYLKLVRIRYGDNEPISVQTALIITERCADLHTHDFSHQSLFRLLSEVYKLEISEIFHTVNAVLATKILADLLQVDIGAPLLREDSVTYLSDGDPIESTTSFFRADKYEYSVRFQHTKEKSIWKSY